MKVKVQLSAPRARIVEVEETKSSPRPLSYVQVVDSTWDWALSACPFWLQSQMIYILFCNIFRQYGKWVCNNIQRQILDVRSILSPYEKVKVHSKQYWNKNVTKHTLTRNTFWVLIFSVPFCTMVSSFITSCIVSNSKLNLLSSRACEQRNIHFALLRCLCSLIQLSREVWRGLLIICNSSKSTDNAIICFSQLQLYSSPQHPFAQNISSIWIWLRHWC